MSLRDDLYASSDTWKPEIDDLLGAFSSDLLEDWEVYERGFEGRPWEHSMPSSERYDKTPRYHYPSESFQFAYLPESIEPTGWIEQTNEVYVRYQTGYDRDFDIDPDGDREKKPNERAWENRGKEPKYVVKGTFVDPIITRSIERVVEHVENEMERVATATEFNAEIERLSYTRFSDFDEPPEDPSEYTEQSSPFTSVDGVGSTSIERLASRFGTYYNVTLDDGGQISDCVSSWHRPSSEKIISAISEVLDRYNRFRERDDWNRIKVAPETWTEYPKEQPR